jgi:hypothetical protein
LLERHLLVPCLLIVSALALVACGSGSSDTSQIEEAIETSATTTDPGDCTTVQTQNFNEQATQESGKAALKACEKEAEEPHGQSKSAAVSKVEVEGSKATADAALSGGNFDGQTVEVALVKDGDQWKVDELTGFAKLDQAKVVEVFEREFAKPSSGVSKSLAACVSEGLGEASQSEFEELLLAGSSTPIEELAEACS